MTISTVVMTTVLLVTELQIAQASTAIEKPTLFDSAARAYFFDRAKPDELQKKVDYWVQAPIYQTLVVDKYLLDHLLVVDKCHTPTYVWQKGAHDLGRVAGRTAFAIESIYSIKLPVISPESRASDLREAHAEASRLMAAYRAGVLRLASERRGKHSLENLKLAYRDKIRHTQKTANQAAEAFDDLLREWFPIGQPIADLEEIVGYPGRRIDGRVAYRFDDGVGGTEYQFIVKEGAIETIRKAGLY